MLILCLYKLIGANLPKRSHFPCSKDSKAQCGGRDNQQTEGSWWAQGEEEEI